MGIKFGEEGFGFGIRDSKLSSNLLGRVSRSRPPQIHEKLSTLVLNLVAYHEGEPSTVAWQ